MKSQLFFLTGLLLLGTVHAGDWENLSVRNSAGKRDLTLFSGKSRKGSVRDFEKSGLVTASEQDGMLLLNTARFQKAHPGKTLDFYYFLDNPNPGKTVVLEAELAGPEGASADLYFEGSTGKHFWRRKTVVLKEKPSLYQFELKFPETLRSVSFRITFKDLPYLKIGKISYGVKKTTKKPIPVPIIFSTAARNGDSTMCIRPPRSGSPDLP